MAKPISSLSDADTRLAELNTLILELERERSALLAAELANAETRVSEIESFIGVYVASSPVGGAKASTTRKSAEKKATSKRRGRPPGPGKTKATSKRRGRPPGSGKKKAATTKPAAKPTTKGVVPGELITITGVVLVVLVMVLVVLRVVFLAVLAVVASHYFHYH